MGGRCVRNTDPDEEEAAPGELYPVARGLGPRPPTRRALIAGPKKVAESIECLTCRCNRSSDPLEIALEDAPMESPVIASFTEVAAHRGTIAAPELSRDDVPEWGTIMRRRMELHRKSRRGDGRVEQPKFCGTCSRPSIEPSLSPEVSWAPMPVTLHIYDVGTCSEIKVLNRLLRPLGTGVFHCGVEVFGNEWSYSDTLDGGGSGIFCCPPRGCHGHNYVETVAMGKTAMPELEVLDMINLLESAWQVSDYHLLSHNCCHFCDELCQRLGVGSIPAWVMNLASTGAAIVSTGDTTCCRQVASQCFGSSNDVSEMTLVQVQVMSN